MAKLLRKPEMQISNFTKMIRSEKTITVVSAVAVTPLTLGLVDQLRTRFTILAGHLALALLVASFIAFVLAGFFTGILQDIILGVSIGLFVNTLLALPPVANAVGRASGTAPNAGTS